MPLILFPAWRSEQPENPWLSELCSHCGKLELREAGTAGDERFCGCRHDGEPYAVITVLTADPRQVWEQLTPHAPDHVVGRVLRVMDGREGNRGAES